MISWKAVRNIKKRGLGGRAQTSSAQCEQPQGHLVNAADELGKMGIKKIRGPTGGLLGVKKLVEEAEEVGHFQSVERDLKQ